jgi:hypothetical protein
MAIVKVEVTLPTAEMFRPVSPDQYDMVEPNLVIISFLLGPISLAGWGLWALVTDASLTATSDLLAYLIVSAFGLILWGMAASKIRSI